MIITQKVGLYKFKNDAKNNYTQWESNPRNPEHELIVLQLHHCLHCQIILLMLGLHYVPGSHGSHGSQNRSSP